MAEGITHHAPATFASSFGAEDMVLLDLIERLELAVEVFTLDTGRLHEETLDLIARCGERYRRPIRIMAPDAAELESFVGHFGINAFYREIDDASVIGDDLVEHAVIGEQNLLRLLPAAEHVVDVEELNRSELLRMARRRGGVDRPIVVAGGNLLPFG